MYVDKLTPIELNDSGVTLKRGVYHFIARNVKGTRIQTQFLFLVEKSKLYAKITESQNKNGFKTQF